MVQIGRVNNLQIIRIEEIGLYLDGEDLGDILLPKQYIDQKYEIDSYMDVFIYLDSEDRFIATTERPIAQVGDFALLECVGVNEGLGAFVDWGLPKDLLVPKREQLSDMMRGSSYMVYIYVDERSNRLAATAKTNKYLDLELPKFEENEEVDIIISGRTDLGYKAIINKAFTGVIYQNEVFQDLQRGMHLKAYIKKVRSDSKIDLSLKPLGSKGIDKSAEMVYNKLVANNGFMMISDKSPAEEIYETFEMSKKAFKKAIGTLYKQRMIIFKNDGIKLND